MPWSMWPNSISPPRRPPDRAADRPKVAATTPQPGSPRRLPDASGNQLKSARRLRRRKERTVASQFLVEGPRAVSEALAASAPLSLMLLTTTAADRHPELVADATSRGVACRHVAERDLASIADAVTPAGIVGVCASLDMDLSVVLSGPARLVVCGAEIRDPGNAGTIVRCGDAAGADAVIFGSSSVDLYNPKTVRASTGSIFHLPVSVGSDPAQVIADCRKHGLQVLAASGSGPVGLDELIGTGELERPTLWLFGNEANGLDPGHLAMADRQVRVPIYGHAESLNLATAAAVCLYASAFALEAFADTL